MSGCGPALAKSSGEWQGWQIVFPEKARFVRFFGDPPPGRGVVRGLWRNCGNRACTDECVPHRMKFSKSFSRIAADEAENHEPRRTACIFFNSPEIETPCWLPN
jgi:hypothetical protein